jgi:uncharacterized protein (UPF0335 family)
MKEISPIQTELKKYFELIDNSTNEKSSLSSQIENIYFKLKSHQQQIDEFETLINFKPIQT